MRIPVQTSLLPQSAEQRARMALWRRDPNEGFALFLRSTEYVLKGDRPPAVDSEGSPRRLSERTCAVYRTMFRAFVRWLDGRTIFEVTASDLLRFLDTQTAAKTDARKVSRIRSDYLRMLKRVFDHLEVDGNPAADLAYEAREVPGGGGRDRPMSAIPAAQLAAFIAALPNAVEARQWKRRRDRAMQALMLGSGLTVDEVIRLRGSDVGKPDATGAISVTIKRDAVPPKRRRQRAAGDMGPPATRRDHTTLLWPELAPIVVAWKKERLALGIGGNLLFPAGPIGGENAECPVDRTTVYRQAKKTFERAGIVVARRGCRTLRNTFAVHELANGRPKDAVYEFLGHHEKRAVDLYDRAKTALGTGTKPQSR